MGKIQEVYSIFQEMFGEERVDITYICGGGDNYDIQVHFPNVTVTNEYNTSVNIKNLFVKVTVAGDGTIRGTFQICRTEFTKEQWDSGYIHSHVPRLYVDEIPNYRIPCLGSGPIVSTITSLTTESDEDIWRLFCFELIKYIETESIEGVPYMRMQSIGDSQKWIPHEIKLILHNDAKFYSHLHFIIDDFYPVVVKSKKIPFVFIDGGYTIGMSVYDFAITVSNLFIEWYNSLPNDEKPERLLHNIDIGSFIETVKCSNGMIYRRNNYLRNRNYDSVLGRDVLEFKGKMIKLNITDLDVPEEDNGHISTILKSNLLEAIANKLLIDVNLTYGKLKSIKPDNCSLCTPIGESVKIL